VPCAGEDVDEGCLRQYATWITSAGGLLFVEGRRCRGVTVKALRDCTKRLVVQQDSLAW
jgi:hypothetical protein